MASRGIQSKHNNTHNNCSNPHNRLLLEQADELQRQSKEVVQRCQRQLIVTEELGIDTLQELRNQNQTLTQLQDVADITNKKLDHTQKLLNRYDRGAFHWFGRNKRQAQREGKKMMKERKLLEQPKPSEPPTHKTATGSHYNSNESQRSQLIPTSRHSQLRTVETKLIDVDGDTSSLDQEAKDHLRSIQDQDKALDEMLHGMVESLDRLSQISRTMSVDISQGNRQMDQVVKRVDEVNEKQLVAQGRLRRILNK